jgi:hypothetical protein
MAVANSKPPASNDGEYLMALQVNAEAGFFSS